MISYTDKIKKERLSVIISNIDDDGESQRSNRRPMLKVYGLQSSSIAIPTVPNDITSMPDSRFIELISFDLYRPSFVFVNYTKNLIKLNTPTVDTTIHGVIVTIGQLYFARIFNAKVKPEAVIQLDVGNETSNAAIKISGILPNLIINNSDQSLYINAHYIFEI